MKTLFSIAVLVFYVSASAQIVPQIEWELNIGGDGWDECRSIVETPDGGFILGGFSESDISGNKTAPSFGTYDFWVVKISVFGTVEWERSYGGNLREQCYRCVPTADGGFIMGGWSESGVNGNKTTENFGLRDCWVVKTDADGEIEWQTSVGGAGDDYIFTLHQLADGGYIFGGFSESGISGNKTEENLGGMDYFVFKLSADGELLWQNTIGGSAEDRLHAILELEDGSFICGGTSESTDFDHTAPMKGIEDYWVLKLDATGNPIWDKSYGGNDVDELFDIGIDPEGNFVFAGFTVTSADGDVTEPITGMQDGWAVKTDPDGNILWQNTIGGDMGDRLECASIMNDGNYFLGSGSYSPLSGDLIEASYDWDYWLKKFDKETGDIIWQVNYGGYGIDLPRTIIATADGSFAACGESTSDIGLEKFTPNYGEYDYWIIKLTCENPITWYADTDGDGFGTDAETRFTCTSYPGFVLNADDCDDANAGIFPGATEVCNTLDDNCNGNTDEDAEFWSYADADGDTWGDSDIAIFACPAPAGFVTDSTDCDDTNSAIFPWNTEICNELDDNCDGNTDEFVTLIFWADADGDTYGDENTFTYACIAPDGYTTDFSDCDDTNPDIYPGADEIANGLDDNCNELVDENVAVQQYTPVLMQVYPNPVGGNTCTIHCPTPEPALLQLFNPIGERITEKHTNGAIEILDMHAIPAGIYILKWSTSNQVSTATLIRN